MAINPGTATYPSNSFPANLAVQDVDIHAAVDDINVKSAKALVVIGSGANGASEVTTRPISATYASKSGTITVGGASQVLMAANADRKGFMIQNRSSENLYVNSLAVAANDGSSLELTPGQLYEPAAIPLTAINIIGATIGSAFFAREW